ncbi:MAG TPA: pseudouridine synthase [Ignavibacteria bacterium]|nr:pseudouridine synthase [Ignavibacteria bacterium]
MENLTRLNKFIAANGVSSRRKIDELIVEGRVTVNSKTITELGFKIDPENDKISVDGELIRINTKKIYIILNKPVGVITSVSDEKKRTTVIDLVKLNQKIFPVGRLDYNTSGLILLTNDGDLANKLMNPKSKIYKTYFVELSRPLEEKHRLKLASGVKIEGVMTAPSIIKFPKANDYLRLYISIHEGRNRQIHNMFETYGYFVRTLQRFEYAGLKLGGLREGEWRYLTAVEVAELKKIVKDTPANYVKPAGERKRQFKKVANKYKSQGEVRDRKSSFRKSEKPFEKAEKVLGYNKKRDEDRGLELGFKKNDALNEKRSFKKFDKTERFSNNDDRKDFKKDYKKSDRFNKNDDKKDFKKDFKKSDRFGKSDDKKDLKRDFKSKSKNFTTKNAKNSQRSLRSKR